MTIMELLRLNIHADRCIEVFEKDAKQQGIYVPPMMLQHIGQNNEVVSTVEITDEGSKTTMGGKYGHFPSAPEEFNLRNAENWQKMGVGVDKATEAAAQSKTATGTMDMPDSKNYNEQDSDKGK